MRILFLLFIVLFFSCGTPSEQAQTIIDEAIITHGCNAQMEKTISFTFRDKKYSTSHQDDRYIYTRSFTDSTGHIIDSLVNSRDFTRYRNDTIVEISEEWQTKYANSVNSVLYFFHLPCLLNDPAVNKTYEGSTEIKGELYNEIRVTFESYGGGEDFEDVYVYWIHSKRKTLDYLAYNYQTNGGGTRFRQAINRKTINGVIFQDYINYAPEEKFQPLESLPVLFESDQLKELSKIKKEEIAFQ